MKVTPKEIEAVIRLPGNIRYQRFMKMIVDWEEVWGLYKDGWALAATNENKKVFPLWPAQEYAKICAIGDWSGYEPSSFSLEDLTGELLPKLRRDDVFPGVFYTPADKGIVLSVEQLLSDIKKEASNYE